MKLVAIDPGSTESAWLLYDVATGLPLEWAKIPNVDLLDHLKALSAVGADVLAIEMIASYGMAVGAEVFDTCVWIGRFLERWQAVALRTETERVFRREVKLHLCGSPRAKDTNVRQALIDRYGGKDQAIGRKATPGPLYGLSGDGWAALGVAVTYAER